MIKALRYETGKVPEAYETDFRKADQTFLYQMVFDPRTQKQVRLNHLPDDVDAADFEFAGVYLTHIITFFDKHRRNSVCCLCCGSVLTPSPVRHLLGRLLEWPEGISTL